MFNHPDEFRLGMFRAQLAERGADRFLNSEEAKKWRNPKVIPSRLALMLQGQELPFQPTDSPDVSSRNEEPSEWLERFDEKLYYDRLREKEMAAAVAVDPTKKVYRRLGANFGRQCNQMVIISMGLSIAKRDGFTLTIDKDSFPVLSKLDLELFEETFKGLFIFRHKNEPLPENSVESDALDAPPTYWCGLKIKLDSIRKGFRPKKEFREAAEQEVAKMREVIGLNADLMSVHVRIYDGFCDKLVPDVCEWTQGYEFRPVPFGCNQTLTKEYLQWIKADWPDHDWANRPLSIYLSTDRQSEAVDKSFTEGYRSLGIQSVFEPNLLLKQKTVRNEYHSTGEMLVDMWISVLTDFHVGMPRSSCDKIIAEWRGVVKEQGKQLQLDTVHPRGCFSNYYYNPPETIASSPEVCPYTKFLALDAKKLPNPNESICAVCELLLALSLSISKAIKHGMGLHLSGVWGKFIKDNLDVDALKEELIYVSFVEHEENLLYDRVQVYHSGKFRGSAVRAENQVECSKGKRMEHLAMLTIVPRAEIIAKVETVQFRHSDPEEMNNCGRSTANINLDPWSGYCYVDDVNKKCPTTNLGPAARVRSRSYMHDLWERVLADQYEFEPTSPCSQIIALWRAGKGKRNNCCFEGYSHASEPTEMSELFDSIYWICP